MTKKILIVGLFVFAVIRSQAQLAITEIQTSESANSLSSKGSSGPDWWELSNYGATNIDLTGYVWYDGGHTLQQGPDAPFTGVTIAPGETIIITETNKTIFTAALFRQWWGIGDNVQIILSANSHGLSSSSEAVRLWTPAATNSTDPNDAADLVDRVDVGAAGVAPNSGVPTFIYDTNNGSFDMFSTNGVGGAFTAATSAEVGSPGIAPNAMGIVIVQQPSPANFTIPTNNPITYTVAGYGLPKPRFQWLFNGAPVDTNALGAVITFAITNNQSISTLTIPVVQLGDAGTFSAMASNDVGTTVICSNAVLNVTTTPSAPEIESFSPTNLAAYIGQTVTFSVNAFGSPSPTYQWQLNDANLNGQTGSQLQVSLTGTNQMGTYSVIVTNSVGGTNASGFLFVTPKPDLRITEVMSSESTNDDNGDTSKHSDWWELSNFGNFAVNLNGYRFDDDNLSFSDAVTITNNVTIQPGESIVLVEKMTPDQFRAWWSAANLPANLQIIDYPKIGFSATSDSVRLWNAAATSVDDFIDSVDIGTAERGISFGYDPNFNDPEPGFLGFDPDGLSVVGVNGTFVAPVGGDIGSPGTVLNLPNINSATQTNGGFSLSWANQPNWNYSVEYKTNLTDPTWQTLTNFTSDSSGIVNIVDLTTNTQRFYRVKTDLQNQ